jgi:peptidyl-prolyl cis-trans isomerase C
VNKKSYLQKRRDAIPLVTLCLALLQSTYLFGADALFQDPVVAKAKTFQIRESDVQTAYVEFKAAAIALGQSAPPGTEEQIKAQLLDKLIATKLLLARATSPDREEGKKLAQRLIGQTQNNAGSAGAYRRRLLAVGSSPEKYEAEVLEQATVQAVIDRELKNKRVVSEAEVKKFYDDHPQSFTEPEKARVAHILFATRKIPSGEPLPLEQRLAKKTAAERVLARARAGEDFSALVKEFTDDPDTRMKKGELTFLKGSGVVPPQFDAAAFSLKPGQISDLVQTVFGFDIVKLLEKFPPTKVPLDKVHDEIRDRLQQQTAQEKLPEFVANLRKEAGVQILTAK